LVFEQGKAMTSRYGRRKRRADRQRIAELEIAASVLEKQVQLLNQLVTTAREEGVEDGASQIINARFLPETVSMIREHLGRSFGEKVAAIAVQLEDQDHRRMPFRYRARVEPMSQTIRFIEGEIPSLRYRVALSEGW
jgi:hypothetical protein